MGPAAAAELDADGSRGRASTRSARPDEVVSSGSMLSHSILVVALAGRNRRRRCLEGGWD
jgi:hypothetical protein